MASNLNNHYMGTALARIINFFADSKCCIASLMMRENHVGDRRLCIEFEEDDDEGMGIAEGYIFVEASRAGVIRLLWCAIDEEDNPYYMGRAFWSEQEVHIANGKYKELDVYRLLSDCFTSYCMGVEFNFSLNR